MSTGGLQQGQQQGQHWLLGVVLVHGKHLQTDLVLLSPRHLILNVLQGKTRSAGSTWQVLQWLETYRLHMR